MQHTPSHESHIDDEMLSERLDGRLTATAQQRVDQHLGDCAECAARYDGLRATRSALHALRAVTPPRDFRLDVTAHAPTSPRPLNAVRATGFGRLLSAAALICGLLFLAVGLFTLTVSHNAMSQNAAAGIASQAAPTANATSCTPREHCPSANAGDAPRATPTNTAAYGSVAPPATATMLPTRTSAGAGTYATSQTPVAADYNITPSLLVIGFGILTTLAGAIGLSRWGKSQTGA